MPDTKLIHMLAELATAALRQDRPAIFSNTAARHQLLSTLLNEAVAEAKRTGRPAVRAADAALTKWVADNYVRQTQESGLPAGTGEFSNPKSSIKQYAGEVGRPWIKDIPLEEGDWYRVRLDFWRCAGVFHLAWRFFGITYRGQALELPEADAVPPPAVAECEVTSKDDAAAVGWFLGITPGATEPARPADQEAGASDDRLRKEAEHFYATCLLVEQRTPFSYPKRKRKRSDPTLTVKWPRPLRKMAVTSVLLAILAVPGGCYLHDRWQRTSSLRDMTISAGATCDATGRPVARIFFSTPLRPPVELRRDDEVIGLMQATSRRDNQWEYHFQDTTVAPGRAYDYRVAARMWATNEPLLSSRVAVLVPSCRPGNTVPSIASIRSPIKVVAGEPVQFEAVGVRDPDGDRLTIMWTFGEGDDVGSGARVTHTYWTPGGKVVAASVRDSAGGVALTSTTIEVLPGTRSFVRPPPAATGTGRVSPREAAPVGTEFRFLATPPGEATADCKAPLTYRFTLENPTAGKMLDSPWMNGREIRQRLQERGLWFVTYRVRCGERLIGTYSFGIDEVASVR